MVISPFRRIDNIASSWLPGKERMNNVCLVDTRIKLRRDRDVDIITFDELLGKLQLMRQHLSPPPSPEPTQECDIPF